jgi:hypothetical protein
MSALVLNGPSGWRIVCDASEIIPSDPGAGTPVMIYGPRDVSGTWFAWIGAGEVDGIEPPPVVAAWLDKVASSVDDWMDTAGA